MKLDRSTLVVLVLAVAAGYWLASGQASPVPSRPTDRPVLRWIARAAKSALWLMLVAEPAPPEPAHLVNAPHVGEDGYPIVDHGRGW